MGVGLANVFRLGVKELFSLRADPILLFLIFYIFSLAVYSQSTGAKYDVENVAVGIVDEDHSELSRRIAAAILEPYFKPAVEITADQIDQEMNSSRLVFVLEIPPKLEFDALAGRVPTIQIDVDATAVAQAGIGASYLQNIIAQEASSYLQRNEGAASLPINLVMRTAFNPNRTTEWFLAAMAIINAITQIGVILTGSALIREREHGTIEHLLVMPVRPTEIMLAKIWANGLVVLVAALLSLWFVAHVALRMPLGGSPALLIAGMALYQLSIGALGILLATFVGTMGQFGLLMLPVLIILNLLSGAETPYESMPVWIQQVMELAPTTHFVRFSQAVLYRGAGLDIVWHDLAALAAITAVFFGVSLMRFRTTIASIQ